MQVVVGHAPVPPERYQSVRGPGKVIARVVLHRQPDVEHMEDQDSKRVALKEHHVHHVKETQGKQLPDAHVLRGERERGRVLVVPLVEGPVQPGHLVVQHVPQEELGVEEQQAEHDVAHQLEQLRGFRRQEGPAAGPAEQRHGEHEHQVLVERLPQAGQQLPRRWPEVGVDFVAPQRGHPGAQEVQRHEGQAEAHVGGDGKDGREEGRLGEGLPGPQAVPQGLQEQPTGAAENLEIGGVAAAHGEAALAGGCCSGATGFSWGLGPAPNDVSRLFPTAQSLQKYITLQLCA